MSLAIPAPSPLEVARAITDDGTRAVMTSCVARAQSAKDIASHTGIPLTTVYRLLHRLQTLHVLAIERSAMTPEGRKYDLYRSLVREAHLDMDESGTRVRWLPNAPRVEVVAATSWRP